MLGLHTLDRYLLSEYLKALALALLSFVGLFLVVDFIEKLNRFLDHNPEWWAIASYFLWKVPYILVMMMPVALLMATFFTLGQMARFNELSAIVTSGVSLVRLAAPVLIIAALASVISFVLGELVVPDATARREEILHNDIEKIPRTPNTQRNDIALKGRDGRVYVVRTYLVPEKRMHNISIYRYAEGRLISRIDARMAVWNGSAWELSPVIERKFLSDGNEVTEKSEKMIYETTEGPEEFSSLPSDPDQLGYFDLRNYIDRVAEQGRELDPYRIDLHVKLSFPIANLILGMIACALAMQLRHATPALSFGLTISIAFFYLGLMRLCEALGDGGILPPWAAGWIPAIVFGSWAFFLLFRLGRR
jgi:lipopolysaccharide export system permease protein